MSKPGAHDTVLDGASEINMFFPHAGGSTSCLQPYFKRRDCAAEIIASCVSSEQGNTIRSAHHRLL